MKGEDVARIDTSTLGPIVLNPRQIAGERLAQMVRDMPIGGLMTIERIAEKRVRIRQEDTLA